MGGPPPNLPSTTTTTATRLRRENFQRTKHDSAFSKWKILIGPTDWEDYEAQKEGAERYRVGNLPQVSGPGLYEIGVAIYPTASGRDVAKLESDRIVVVYLGQADNVRSRLQHYGRSGSHLSIGFCFFKDIFSRGYPILYRWAPMKSKSEAERTEAKLLDRFDYAWNKVGNGARRPNDVLHKIELISSQNNKMSKIVKILQSLTEQKVGIPIKAEKMSLFDSKPSNEIYDEKFSLFDRIFKFSRSQPRLVTGTNSESTVKKFNQTHICGVILTDGSTCSDPPVKGRKRCAKHKGRRLSSALVYSKSMIKDSSNDTSQEENFPPITNDGKDEFSSICGVILLDGSPCTKPPFPGRKRCEEHKGMRINHILSKASNVKSVVEKSVANVDLVGHCGVNLGDGKCCEKQAVKGRKRCELHKGMRVDAYVSKLLLSRD